MFSLSRIASTLIVLLSSILTPTAGWADTTFPDRPLRLVVPFSPGSGTDQTARYLAREMEASLGVSVMVENRPGANSFIAANLVSGAKPDGYTLLVSGSSAMTVNVATFKSLPYDPVKDFSPIARLARGAMALAVPNDSPYKSVSDLLEAARKNPTKLNYGSGSAAYQITTELFLSRASVKANHIPYKGAAQALTDLVGGQVDFTFADYAAVLPLVQGGKLKLLAVTSAERLSSAPAVPALTEVGFPGFDMINWTSLFAPAGTPPEVVDKLARAVVSIYENQKTRDFLASTNWESFPGGPDVLRSYQQQEIAKWSKAADAAGIEKI